MDDQADRTIDTPLFIDELLSALGHGDTVLDLGCGQGTFSCEKYPYLRISALDIVRPDVRLPDHVKFRLGTAQSLPYDDGTLTGRSACPSWGITMRCTPSLMRV